MSDGDWRSGLDAVDAELLDAWQSGFPVRPDPFEAVGEALGVSADAAVERVDALLEAGLLRRFGPVLNPPVIGASTLAALRVPEDRFDAVADVVDGYRQVNHNYRRDHEWNMWFVVTAARVERRDAILAGVADRTGLEPLVLPMNTDYYIDLEFPVVNRDRFARESGGGTDASPTRVAEAAATDLTGRQRRLILAVQEGLPVTRRPYAAVADRLGTTTEAVLTALRALLERNAVKRVGCVVHHPRVGFDSNCMVVWDVPDDELDARGVAAGERPFVTLCYHRPRRSERDWPYNLFTMVHGRDPDSVDAKVDELAADVIGAPHERLYSTRTLKQTGARYEDLLDVDAATH